MDNIQQQLYLFNQGTYYNAYELMGCHFCVRNKKAGAVFRVWAPNAKKVNLLGDFNNWNNTLHPMKMLNKSGVWEVFVEGVKVYDKYKYEITSKSNYVQLKADPYAFFSETNGKTASMAYELEGYVWHDQDYLKALQNKDVYNTPMNIYEVNFGSWKRRENYEYYTYKMLADELIPYLVNMGYTHVEVMPITEYPYDGSWGYQVTGYYSITSRFGEPKDFMYFVDKCHQNGISVIMDWVPAHFPKDDFGLIEFDGEPLYENKGWDRQEHKSWGTRRFDYGRTQVQCFLISSAMFLLNKFHIDGLRVDAVASMLYLDYDKKPGEWIPNENGDNKNLEAIAFLQKLNSAVFKSFPKALMIAEESTAWPMVTKPTDIGGLGFNFKWNIGWMNDTLEYVKTDPYFRKYKHDKLTFSMFYAFSENFILPISHDEVVHGKASLLNKMFGDYNQKFDELRIFFCYMFAHPGKKLNFMGNEFGQFIEWDYKKGLDFCLLDFESHHKLNQFVKELNFFYQTNSELYERDFSWEGFKWIVADDKEQNVLSFSRYNSRGDELIFIVNFSNVQRDNYCIGVDKLGVYEEVFTSNLERFGGNGKTMGCISAQKGGMHGRANHISLNLSPLSASFFKLKSRKITI